MTTGPWSHRGNDDGTRQGDQQRNTGDPLRWLNGFGQPDAREGQAGPEWKSERFVVPSKPGNAGGGKGPHFQMSERQVDNSEIGDEPTTS